MKKIIRKSKITMSWTNSRLQTKNCKTYIRCKKPCNSTSRMCSEHLRDCNQAEPYFQIFPFYYETNTALREYKEKQYILRWKPQLNLNKT